MQHLVRHFINKLSSLLMIETYQTSSLLCTFLWIDMNRRNSSAYVLLWKVLFLLCCGFLFFTCRCTLHKICNRNLSLLKVEMSRPRSRSPRYRWAWCHHDNRSINPLFSLYCSFWATSLASVCFCTTVSEKKHNFQFSLHFAWFAEITFFSQSEIGITIWNTRSTSGVNMLCCNIFPPRTSPRRHEGVGGYSRRFPWDEPDFDPQKVLAELDGVPMDRKRHPREDLEERWNYLREDARSDSRRRSPPFPDSRPPGLQHHPEPEEFYRRTPPPHPYELDYAERRRLSPDRREGGGEGERGRGGFREHYKGFENRGRLSHSPQRLSRERLSRERLPSAPQSHLEPREPAVGWRREEQGRSRGSPRPRSDDHAGGEGRERGRRDAQGLNRERRRDDPHQERSPPFKRHRREMDDSVHLG